MGACISQKKTQARLRKYHTDFITDRLIELPNLNSTIQILKPRFSKLYNIVRNIKDLQIIHSSRQKPLLMNSTTLKLQQIDNDKIKTLFKLKNILIIGQVQPYKKYLQQISSKQIYNITYLEAKQFVKLFPIYAWKGQISALTTQKIQYQIKDTPLLIFLKEELFRSSMSPIQKIFLHSFQCRNPKIYQALHIDQTINITQSPTQIQKKQHYLSQLSKSKGNVLIVYNSIINQQQLLSLFATFLSRTYKIEEQSAVEYIGQNLGRLTFTTSKFLRLKSKKSSTKQQSTIIMKILLQIQKESGSKAKTLQIYNLGLQSISNITNNPQDQNYRRIKKSDERIREAVKYPHAIQLLQILGWNRQSELWQNKQDIESIKEIILNLQLAYSRYLSIDQIPF